MIRKALGFATPALAVGLLLATQAMGRPHNHQAQRGGGGSANGIVRSQENLVNRLIQNEQASVNRNLQLIQAQNNVNQRLFQLSQIVPANPLQAAMVQRAINHNLAIFNRMQNILNVSQAHIVNNEPLIDQRINQSLSVLEQFAATNPAIAQFIEQALLRQQAAANLLEQIASRPPATPFVPF